VLVVGEMGKKCLSCGCSQFEPGAFKPEKCATCSHDHGSKPFADPLEQKEREREEQAAKEAWGDEDALSSSVGSDTGSSDKKEKDGKKSKMALMMEKAKSKTSEISVAAKGFSLDKQGSASNSPSQQHSGSHTGGASPPASGNRRNNVRASKSFNLGDESADDAPPTWASGRGGLRSTGRALTDDDIERGSDKGGSEFPPGAGDAPLNTAGRAPPVRPARRGTMAVLAPEEKPTSSPAMSSPAPASQAPPASSPSQKDPPPLNSKKSRALLSRMGSETSKFKATMGRKRKEAQDRAREKREQRQKLQSEARARRATFDGVDGTLCVC
jgi:hypothetical protein